MKQFPYQDGLRPRGRKPRLFLFKPGHKAVEFKGESIPGIVQVVSQSYTRNGKWSSNDYSLAVGDNTVPCQFLLPLHGDKYFPDWGSIEGLMQRNAARAGSAFFFNEFLTEEEFLEFLREFFPNVIEKLNAAQAAFNDLD